MFAFKKPQRDMRFSYVNRVEIDSQWRQLTNRPVLTRNVSLQYYRYPTIVDNKRHGLRR